MRPSMTSPASPSRIGRSAPSPGSMRLTPDGVAPPRVEVAHDAVEGREPAVVRLGNVDPQLAVHVDDQVQEVHRVDVDLLTKGPIARQGGRINLGSDARERRQHGGPDVVSRHRSSGLASARRSSRRNRAPRHPSLTRWSAESVAVTTGRAPRSPPSAQGRSSTEPKPTMATWGGVITP